MIKNNPKYVSQLQDLQRLRRPPPNPSPRQASVAYTSSLGFPLRWALILEVSFLSPRPHHAEKGVGEAQPATKRRGDGRSETVASAPLLPQPLTLSSSCACAQGRPPSREREGRGRTWRKALGCRSSEPSGHMGSRSSAKALGPTHYMPGMACPGTPQHTHPKGTVGPGTDNPPAHAEPTASRQRLHPASQRTNGAGLGSRGSVRAGTHR